MTEEDESSLPSSTRRELFSMLAVGGIGGTAAALAGVGTVGSFPGIAVADVADGTSLPEGAAQFNRVLRLKNDIAGVRKRVADAGKDLDKKEWDNIGQFLRAAYATGDDMKAVANGIANPDNKKRALEDVDQLRKYAQAGDVSVSKQDPAGFVAVADKMSGLVQDFFDSLSDVPDEL